jgi:hypothetical protein
VNDKKGLEEGGFAAAAESSVRELAQRKLRCCRNDEQPPRLKGTRVGHMLTQRAGSARNFLRFVTFIVVHWCTLRRQRRQRADKMRPSVNESRSALRESRLSSSPSTIPTHSFARQQGSEIHSYTNTFLVLPVIQSCLPLLKNLAMPSSITIRMCIQQNTGSSRVLSAYPSTSYSKCTLLLPSAPHTQQADAFVGLRYFATSMQAAVSLSLTTV